MFKRTYIRKESIKSSPELYLSTLLRGNLKITENKYFTFTPWKKRTCFFFFIPPDGPVHKNYFSFKLLFNFFSVEFVTPGHL